MIYSIDRFEGDYAVLVSDAPDEAVIEVRRALLPEGAVEGDLLSFSGGAYTMMKEQAESRRAEARRLLAELLGEA